MVSKDTRRIKNDVDKALDSIFSELKYSDPVDFPDELKSKHKRVNSAPVVTKKIKMMTIDLTVEDEVKLSTSSGSGSPPASPIISLENPTPSRKKITRAYSMDNVSILLHRVLFKLVTCLVKSYQKYLI